MLFECKFSIHPFSLSLALIQVSSAPLFSISYANKSAIAPEKDAFNIISYMERKKIKLRSLIKIFPPLRFTKSIAASSSLNQRRLPSVSFSLQITTI
jgi:hypothetical protein